MEVRLFLNQAHVFTGSFVLDIWLNLVLTILYLTYNGTENALLNLCDRKLMLLQQLCALRHQLPIIIQFDEDEEESAQIYSAHQ